MRLAWSSLPLLIASCATLKGLTGPAGPAPKPPRIAVAEVALAGHPSAQSIARALCPQIAPAPVCMILGGAPSRAELQITFAVSLDVTNENAFALPLVEALVAFTAFPGATAQAGSNQNLGAVCLSFCDNPSGCVPAPDACTAGGPQIKTVNDFAAASAGFLVGVATGQEKLENLKVRTLAPNGTTRVTVSLMLDPQQVLGLLAKLGTDALSQVKRGQVPQFVIPWQVEGSAWVTVEHLGKIAAGFGPTQGVWEIR
jgi:hypothetical protein